MPANLSATKDIRVLCPDHCEAWLQGICSKVAQDTGLIQDANLMQITRGVAFVAFVLGRLGSGTSSTRFECQCNAAADAADMSLVKPITARHSDQSVGSVG